MLCGDGVQCAGCVGANLRGLYRKVVVMQEGHNTISWRPSEMRNPRLVVDVQDQLSTKAVSETLRARAYGRRQQLTYRLYAHLGLRKAAPFCKALVCCCCFNLPRQRNHSSSSRCPPRTNQPGARICTASLEMPQRK